MTHRVVRMKHPGTPLLTPLSTNATCQLEKTENSAPNPPRRDAHGWFRRARRQSGRRVSRPQHVRNVWDSGVLSRQSDAVNKTDLRVRNEMYGSPKTQFSVSFRQACVTPISPPC